MSKQQAGRDKIETHGIIYEKEIVRNGSFEGGGAVKTIAELHGRTGGHNQGNIDPH
jgi:hypothetical protein